MIQNSANFKGEPGSPTRRQHNYIAQRNIIDETKKIVASKNQSQRFQIAKKYLFNALDYKTPRFDVQDPNASKRLKVAYNIQTFYLWRTMLLYVSYIFMYASFFGHNHPSYTLIGIQFGLLLILLIDLVLEIYHKVHNQVRPTSKFQSRFYVRATCLILLLVDQIIVACRQDLPVRPFLILRCVLPVIYDPQIRKMFYALFSSYIDILVYLIFYMIVIILFSIMVNQFVQYPPDAVYDDFVGNYKDLGKAIYLMYVLTTFDSYPDNQHVAIRFNIWIYGFFIAFIFLNALLFVAIPTNILVNSVRNTRSKTTMVDQIQQQHNLIMAFIAIGGDSTRSIPYQKVIRFLLYVFNHEAKYLDKITQICRNLDQKVNGTIEVSQFMQLCKIIQSKSHLQPPRHQLWKRLSQFQSFIDTKLKLKKLIKSTKFQLFFALFALFAFINCLLTLYTEYLVFDVIDDIIMILILIQNGIKIIGLGPQLYFNNFLNIVDLIIALIGLFFQIAPRSMTPRNAAVFAKMLRIFRVTLLIRYLTKCFNISYQNVVYEKLKRLINQLALLFPILLKFFPMYLITYYFLGVIGVQAFWYETQIKPSQSKYSVYNQFSNFHTLLGSQFIFVQVLTQAGYSLVAYDHAYRYGRFALVMLFFVISHQIIVIILTSLFKGIIWQNYTAIAEEQQEHQNRIKQTLKKQNNLKKRLQKFEQIKKKIQKQQRLAIDNLIIRQIYEKKIDLQFFNKLYQIQTIKIQNKQQNSPQIKHKKKYTGDSLILKNQVRKQNTPIMGNSVSSLNEFKTDSNFFTKKSIQGFQKDHGDTNKTLNIATSFELRQANGQNSEDSQSSYQIQKLKEQDIEKQIDQLLKQMQIHSGVKFSLKVQNPQIFDDFLRQKLKPLKMRKIQKQQFNTDRDVFGTNDSLNDLTHGLHTLLKVQTSQREQRSLILTAMVQRGLITEQKAFKMLTQRSQYEDQLSFDYNWIIRKTYLSHTKQQVIRLFQMQYFSSVYGKSFRQINKSTIFPLMKMQAKLTYCFNNILRYKQIGTYQFFHTLLVIQNKISTILLKQGSIGKFIYQIDGATNSWFTVQLKDSNQLRIHFLKNGVWVYHKGLNKGEIYAGKDIFNLSSYKKQNKQGCEKYIKRLFQSFQSLAFCLDSYQKFFQPQPQKQIYDIFNFFCDVQETKRYSQNNMRISKIMFVILSKQWERQQILPYKLSDFKYDEQQLQKHKKQKQNAFSLDQSQSQTFSKLQQLQQNQDQISVRQGLPFSYIINFMVQLRQTISLNQPNFVHHVQKLLNQHFKQNQKVISKRLKLGSLKKSV